MACPRKGHAMMIDDAPEFRIITSPMSMSDSSKRVRAPRSIGCLTCVRRKVKCDNRKPLCKRCEDGSHVCLGYRRPSKFIHHTPPPTGPPGPPPTISLAGFQPQVVLSFLRNEFLIGFDQPETPGPERSAPDLSSVLLHHASPGYLSGLALAEALFARLHNLDSMARHAAELYGRALQLLRHDLDTDFQLVPGPRAYGNLWCCLFLGLFETVLGANLLTWINHARGISALTQRLGPLAFQNQSANAILETTRSFMIFAAIVEGKRTFLEQSEWKTVPWALQQQQKSFYSRIQDLFCDLPGMFEDTASGNLNGLQARVDRTTRELTNLRWEWECENVQSCWEVAPSPLTSLNGVPLFETVLHYRNVDLAVDTIYFDLLHLLLYRISDKAGLAPVQVQEGEDITLWAFGPRSNNATLVPGPGLDRVQFAVEICRSIDFLIQGKRQSLGAFVLLFPLAVARDHLHGRPAIFAWLSGVIDGISTRTKPA